MKRLFNLHLLYGTILVLLASVVFWGCSDSDDDSGISLEGSWVLSQVVPPVTSSYAPDPSMCANLVFTQEEEPPESSKRWGYKMNGKLPANTYVGNYQVTREALFRQTGEINFVNLGFTERNASPDIKQFESYYLRALVDVDKFEVKKDVLTLWATEQNLKLIFIRGASSCGN